MKRKENENDTSSHFILNRISEMKSLAQDQEAHKGHRSVGRDVCTLGVVVNQQREACVERLHLWDWAGFEICSPF